ncbi:hypothetical protein KIPE111705_39370 [Kibdelosporangium persicum]|uniref:hypothetical protein n=1 Tax=Kibdelosporangium persicum TaxID=2698649 RepID=UPI001566118F|nr:hypothetical protein [Kibdelosporangium persicum]
MAISTAAASAIPVLTSLDPHHIVQGWFALDRHIERTPDGVRVDPVSDKPLLSVVDRFSSVLHSGFAPAAT